MEARSRQVPALGAETLRITLVGRVSLRAGNVEIGEERLAGRQGRLLFAYLVTERGTPVPRDQLADVLWGDSPPATWEKALTVLVSKLRAALGESGLDGSMALTGARGSYRLDVPDDTWVDLDAAEAAVREGAAALVDGRLDDAAQHARAALDIARKAFLPGDDAPWPESKRRELADTADEALACLIDADLAAGRTAEATRRAEEAIALQPFRESGYRRLMQAHAAAGNRAEALRVYDRCRRLLLEELGAYPSPETEAIFRELLAEPQPVAPSQPPEPAASPDTHAAEPEPSRVVPPARRPVARRRARIAGAALAALGAIAVLLVLLSDDDANPRIGGASVASLDLASGTVREVTTAERAYGSIAAGKDGLWATDAANNAIVRLDARDGSVRDTIPVGADPLAAVEAYGSVWVANAGDSTVARVSPERGAVVQTARVGNSPAGIAAGGGAVWIVNRLDSTLTRVDARLGRVSATIPLSAAPSGVAFAAGAVWVSAEVAGIVWRIDPATNEVAESINVGNGADSVVASGRSVWVTNAGDRTVSRIDTRRNAVDATVAVGGVPIAAGAAPGGVWVARTDPAGLVRVGAAHPRLMRTVTLAARPTAVTTTADRLWLTTAATLRRGGTLRVVAAIYGPRSLDPATSYDVWKWQVAASVYDGLVALQRVGGPAGNRVVPDLARSLPAVTDGGRTYRFEVRRGVRYSNGELLRAGDFKHALVRLRRVQSPAAGFFTNVRSITTDDARRTVVFRLRRPDPEFVAKLALPFAVAVPSSTPMRDIQRPPGTGPYRIAWLRKREAVLERNPQFHVWSAAAQPAGYPDRIVVTPDTAPAQVVSPQSIAHHDLVSGTPLAQVAPNLVAAYAPRMRSIPLAGNVFVYLNTREKPFDDARVRRAVNYAVDRQAAARALGAPVLAKPTCQVLPIGLLGYRPYCPYTRGDTDAGVWRGPDLRKARRLVAAAGRRGARVTVWTFPDMADAAREFARGMNEAGLRARARVLPGDKFFTRAGDSRTRTQASVIAWVADYNTPYGFLRNTLDCKSFIPDSALNSNYSAFCDRRIQRAMNRALAAEATDLGRAGKLWADADRELTDAAPVVPLATMQTVTVVSQRVRGLQYHPLLGPLLSQISVR